jgi:antitoxin component YwqK of YwqJK toxin-antitoxin module
MNLKPLIFLPVYFILTTASYAQSVLETEIHNHCINLLNDKGEKEGFWIDSTSTSIKECYYMEGVLDGYYKEYSISGVLLVLGKYDNGRMSGKWYYFNPEGRLCATLTDISTVDKRTSNGKMIPMFRCFFQSYHTNGYVKEEGVVMWVDGDSPLSKTATKYGEWHRYDETGKSR